MNFITEKINFDEAHDIFWTRVFYSAEGREATAVLGTTKTYLYEIFKKSPGTELTQAYMKTWLKIAKGDLTKELPRINSGQPYYKMYASTAEEVSAGLSFLKTT